MIKWAHAGMIVTCYAKYPAFFAHFWVMKPLLATLTENTSTTLLPFYFKSFYLNDSKLIFGNYQDNKICQQVTANKQKNKSVSLRQKISKVSKLFFSDLLRNLSDQVNSSTEVSVQLMYSSSNLWVEYNWSTNLQLGLIWVKFVTVRKMKIPCPSGDTTHMEL